MLDRCLGWKNRAESEQENEWNQKNGRRINNIKHQLNVDYEHFHQN